MIRRTAGWIASAVVLTMIVGADAVTAHVQKPPAKAPQKAPAKKPLPSPTPAASPTPTPPPAPRDLAVTTQYVAGDKTTTSKVSTRGARQRIEYGNEMVVLQQCDLKRVVQINEARQKFLATAMDEPPAPAADKTPSKGGIVTYTTVVTETGERKPMFGRTARHVKSVVTKESSAQACDKKKERVETDGWFIDPPVADACTVAERAPAPAGGDCRDDIRRVGSAASMGYPLAYTLTRIGDEGKSSTMTMTVTSFEPQTLSDSLFSVPDAYTPAKTLAELTAPPAPPKPANATRIGVMPVANASSESVALDALSEALVESLGDARLDAVDLRSTTLAEALDEARTKDCDFVLTTNVGEVKKPSTGMITKVGLSKDYSAKVDFSLVPSKGGPPKLSSSEKSGGLTLKGAIGVARNVSRFMTPFGLLSSRFDFMKTFAALSGPSGAAMQQSPDPVLNTIFFLAGGNNASTEPELKSGDAAVAAAMEKQVKAIADALSSRK